MAGKSVMELADVRAAIAWQADHAAAGGAPCTARVVRAELAILDTDTMTGRRMADWQGLSLADAMPLRIAGALHWLFLTAQDLSLEPVYAGGLTDQAAIDTLVADIANRHDAVLMKWLDGPPQTNEAGRSASIMAGLLWLAQRLGPKFELNEIGASAGINTMMARYFYDLGGVTAGPVRSPMKIVPEWRGPPPPKAEVEILSVRGSDIAPLDLRDPVQAERLQAYVWADATDRMTRLRTAIEMAKHAPPELVRMDAGEFVREQLKWPQERGVTRTLFHSIVWQYLPEATRLEISALMEQAGTKASLERPLAWIALETNRETFSHELQVRYWPGGEDPVILAEAHPHGAWVMWFGKS